MRCLNFSFASVVTLALLAGCIDTSELPRVPDAPRPPVGLVGDWVRLSPHRLRGDTLRLRADSTADGLIVWDETRDARAQYWVTRFGSRDAVDRRTDWRKGYQDGGDADCHFGRKTVGCVSMPLLCIGARDQLACKPLKFVAPDSLFLADGSSFVRVRRTPPETAGPAA